MLRELDHVLKRTYVSLSQAQRLFAKIAGSFTSAFLEDMHIS